MLKNELQLYWKCAIKVISKLKQAYDRLIAGKNQRTITKCNMKTCIVKF
jgi:hypothetical protein